jgi:hypothetical protein
MFIFTLMVNKNNFEIIQDGIIIINDFNIGDDFLFSKLKNEIKWDTSIKSRKTASFGIPYNYSDIKYDFLDFPNFILNILTKIEIIIGYKPNNCLLNYYYENSSKMGYHSDQIDILESNTGIVILSVGSSRVVRFKNKIDNTVFDIEINPNSLFYMTQEIQKKWLHSILPIIDNNNNERISITFRKIKP